MNAQLKHLELTEYIGNETAHAHARITDVNESVWLLFLLLGLVCCVMTMAILKLHARINQLSRIVSPGSLDRMRYVAGLRRYWDEKDKRLPRGPGGEAKR